MFFFLVLLFTCFFTNVIFFLFCHIIDSWLASLVVCFFLHLSFLHRFFLFRLFWVLSQFPFSPLESALAHSRFLFFSSSVYKYINLGLVFFLFCVNHSTCLLFLLLRLLIKEQNFLFLSVLVFISSFSGLLCSVEEVPFFSFLFGSF